ncbi:MAG: hypothetical protein H6752_06990 [Candidatus Omnitrophica bacterium]|nr:hypothetical protein [Candidatus Omnitrophota bacterium]
MSKYLDYAASGEPVVLTKRGKVVVELRRPENSKETARRRLKRLPRTPKSMTLRVRLSTTGNHWGDRS